MNATARSYFADPLWWCGGFAYLLNRFFLKWVFPGSFFMRGHFNDVLLIPCALPPLLFFYRSLGLRKEDCPPTWKEIGFHLALWAVFFEWIGPICLHHGTADAWDVVAYGVGAALAGVTWNVSRLRSFVFPRQGASEICDTAQSSSS